MTICLIVFTNAQSLGNDTPLFNDVWRHQRLCCKEAAVLLGNSPLTIAGD